MAEGLEPIVFLLGPSGAGKSTLGRWLAEDCRFHHIEIDRFEGDGIDLVGLRPEWNAFYLNDDATSLASSIRDRVSNVGAAGAVLSFNSMLLLDPRAIQAAERQGIRTIILYGTAADCLQAFLRREEAMQRGLDQVHWLRHNAHAYIAHSRTEYSPNRLRTFVSGKHRARNELVAEVQSRLGAPTP